MLGQLCLHACVGVVRNPSKGIVLNQPVWTCRLWITQCGRRAGAEEYLIGQEFLMLRCRGAALVQYCSGELSEGDRVHAVSKLVHRPRYAAERAVYFYDSELLVTDSCGFIQRIQC